MFALCLQVMVRLLGFSLHQMILARFRQRKTGDLEHQLSFLFSLPLVTYFRSSTVTSQWSLVAFLLTSEVLVEGLCWVLVLLSGDGDLSGFIPDLFCFVVF
ncbi:hypothetical protein V6N13_099448 [Hibiscus sabdariffa]|uniref:Uncharacterized protein n=1 Tax=Hibiscus sabdariffa TaxID=183260 RepID=A0ABR2PZQ1_9ROSI